MASRRQFLVCFGIAALFARNAGGSRLRSRRFARRSTAGCTDSDTHCAYWADQGYCQSSSSYASHMATNCQASCGSCGGSSNTPAPSPTPAGCTDSDTHCAHWAGQGYCQSSSSYASHMATNCRASCQLCGGGSSPAPAPTPAPTQGTRPTPAPTRAPAPAPAAGGGPSSSTLRAVLDRHNVYRCMHGLNALTWNNAIASNAQQWATSTGGAT